MSKKLGQYSTKQNPVLSKASKLDTKVKLQNTLLKQ